jgi:hypothetical protein
MSYAHVLNDKVESVLDRLVAEDRPLVKPWITQEICARHRDGLAANADADFWQFAAYAHVGEIVRKAINRRAGVRETKAANQGVLPGFVHLQAYYMVERDGMEQGIPVHSMSDEELQAKEDMFKAFGSTCIAHARELARYRNDRRDRRESDTGAA